MGIMTDLEGVSAKTIECDIDKQFFRSVTGALNLLKTYRVCVSAGFEGSITVWIGDDEKYRGSFSRYLRTIDSICTDTKKELKGWLVKWLPMQDNYNKGE